MGKRGIISNTVAHACATERKRIEGERGKKGSDTATVQHSSKVQLLCHRGYGKPSQGGSLSCRTIHRASRAGVTTEVICYLDILLDGTCATKYVTGTCNGDRYRKPLSRILHKACLFWSYIYIGRYI